MTFKFSGIPGIDPELAAQLDENAQLVSAVGDYQSAIIKESTDNQVGVAKSDFKSKMNAMNNKVEAKNAEVLLAIEERDSVLKAFEGVNPNEIEVLKQARDKAPELQSTLDAMKAKFDAAELSIKAQAKELEAQTKKLQSAEVDRTISQVINSFNADYPSVSVKPDAVDLVERLARDSIRFDPEENRARVYKDGSILPTDKGEATPLDLLNIIRTERPSLFNVPTGSGASGSSNNPGSAKTLTRSEFAKLPIAEQGKAALTHTITD